MNKEEQAFYFLLDDYMQIPKTWEDYQIIKNAIAENKQLKDNWNKLKEWLEEEILKLELYKDNMDIDEYLDKKFLLKKVLEKLQEIEGGMKLIEENKQLKEDLKQVLDDVLKAFENNNCIDWNFTEIREKYNFDLLKGDKE